MNVTLWIVQLLLAAIFGFSAAIKGTQSKERTIALGMTGVADVSLRVMRFAAVCEVLGVVGLIGPYWSGILPILTPFAAIGLAVVMVLAARIHWSRSQRFDPGRQRSRRRRPIFRLEQFRPAAPLAGLLPTNYEQERFYRDLAAVDARRDEIASDVPSSREASRYERRTAAGNVVILVLCVVVAVGRWPL